MNQIFSQFPMVAETLAVLSLQQVNLAKYGGTVNDLTYLFADRLINISGSGLAEH